MLKSETHTTAVQKRIKRAFCLSAQCSRPKKAYSVEWDHGQWFVMSNKGGIWSVVDAEGGPSIDGFDFEEISGDHEFGGKARHSKGERRALARVKQLARRTPASTLAGRTRQLNQLVAAVNMELKR